MSTEEINAMHSDVLSASPESDEDKARLVDEVKERGNLAFKAKRWEEADVLYSKAIDTAATHALFSNRAMVRINRKQYAAAVLDADECIKLDPQFAKGYYRKATALEKQRQYGPAYDAYTLCLGKTKKGKEHDKIKKQARDNRAAPPPRLPPPPPPPQPQQLLS